MIDLKNTPRVMAIINITPDSFYAASRVGDASEVVRRAAEALDGGASILDLGAYSTRPGAAEVPEKEELERLLEAAVALREVFPQAALSLDTFRSGVAAAVMERVGACMINDAGGGCDPDIARVAARFGAPYVAMHTRGTPQTMASMCDYTDVVGEVRDWLAGRISEVRAAGVREVVADPGFGFAKRADQNFELLRGLGEICSLGVPVLAGLSRKSMIHKTLDTTPEDSLAGTNALCWEALRAGAAILRVHDPRPAAQIVRLFCKFRGKM